MELFVVKNNVGEVEPVPFKSKAEAKAFRDGLNIAAGQTPEQRLTNPKFRVSKGKDHASFQG